MPLPADTSGQNGVSPRGESHQVLLSSPISPGTQLPETLRPQPATAAAPQLTGLEHCTALPVLPLPPAHWCSLGPPDVWSCCPGHGEQRPPHPRASWSRRRQRCRPRARAGPPQPSKPSLAGSGGSAPTVIRASATRSTLLTVAKHSWIGLNNCSAAGLLRQGHRLPQRWAAALPGTDCDFLLDAAQAVQPALT